MKSKDRETICFSQLTFGHLTQVLLFYYVTVTSGNASHSLLKFQITAVLKISEKLQVLMINLGF